jgi:hypothetical protein
MKTKVTAIGMGALLVMVALAFALPAMAATPGNLGTSANGSIQTAANTASQNRPHPTPDKISLTTGQTITLTSIEGGYRQVGNPSVNGTASGTIQLTVTGVFSHGYALSVTSGTVTVGSQTYTLTSGSAELGPYGRDMVGQAAGSGVQLLFHARSIGSFGSIHNAVVRVDLSNGTTENIVRLLVTVTY